MGITPEDMDDVREILRLANQARGYLKYDEMRDTKLALILARVYERGYLAGIHKTYAQQDQT